MIGVAGMIGAGIFALTGIAAGIAGPAILLAFLLNGITATFTGLAYAELGSAMPEAGGAYIWVREAMGDHMGFIAGWCDWAAHTIACSLYAVTFGAFFSEMVVGFWGLSLIPQSILARLSALAAVALLTYLNYLGAKESGRVGGVVTLFKVLVLIVFAGFGIYHTLTKPNWIEAFTTPSFAPNGVTGILAAMGLTYIAFEGYEIIVQSGEEVKKPEKTIPRAVVVSLWIAVIVYILVAFALIGSIESEVPSWMYLGELAELSLVKVADSIMPFGSLVILAGGLVSTVSAMNATIYSSSRVAFALGRFGYLPKRFASINEVHRTPHTAILFSYVIISAMTLAPIEAVASAADVMFLTLFILVNIVLVILRLRRPDLKRAFRVPLVPWIPIIAVFTQVLIGYYLIVELKHGLFVVTLSVIWILLGLLVYYAYSEKERLHRIEEVTRTVYEEAPVEEAAYKILVPVANPRFGEKLVRFAETIAGKRNGEVVVLNVVRVPSQTPPSYAGIYVESAKKLVRDLMSMLKVPAGGMIKVGHSVAEAILNSVEEVKPQLVVMGWRGRTFRRDYVLGSTIDPVLLKASTDVVVVRFGENSGDDGNGIKYKKVLIPTAGGPHAVLAAEIARDLVSSSNGRVKLLYVGKSVEDKNKAEKAFEELADVLEDVEIEKEFVVSSRTVEKICEEAEKHDITLVGATNEPFLKNFLLGVFPEKIVERTSKSVAMTRKWVGIVEAIRR